MNVANCNKDENYCHRGIDIGIGNTFQQHYREYILAKLAKVLFIM